MGQGYSIECCPRESQTYETCLKSTLKAPAGSTGALETMCRDEFEDYRECWMKCMRIQLARRTGRESELSDAEKRWGAEYDRQNAPLHAVPPMQTTSATSSSTSTTTSTTSSSKPAS